MNVPVIIKSEIDFFPNGALTFSKQLSDILDVPLHEIGEDLDGDYTVLCSSYGIGSINSIRNGWAKLPKPIIVVTHDSSDVVGGNKGFWNYFKQDIGAMIYTIPKTKHYSPEGIELYFLSKLPYVMKDRGCLGDKENMVCAIGRITPEKGLVTVAKLARMDIGVIIAGFSTDRQDDFYYNDLLRSYGCTLRINPTDLQRDGIYRASKIFFNFTILIEKECSIEYTMLEAMSFGCVPVVGKWMEKIYQEVGLKGCFVECAEEAVDFINQIYASDELYSEISENNYLVMENWKDDFLKEWTGIINKIGG